jgi:serine/threonine protein kinase
MLVTAASDTPNATQLKRAPVIRASSKRPKLHQGTRRRNRLDAVSSARVSVAPGTLVAGDYRIVSPLAQGGMGEVYVAEQLSTGKRRALKLMKADLVKVPGLLARFEQEARIGARITSEHVVEVVGAGVDASLGMPWLAMELLEGENLEAMLARRGPIPWPEARSLFSQIGHAVGAAHEAGVVHRDLKPENVFVARAQQVGVAHRVKILDFGIAKLFEDAKSSNTGQLSLGTPRYMAPEQTGGQPITPATDVWALGLIAYRVLAGRYYWKHADGAPGDTVMALMREILFEPLVPASRRAAEQGVGGRLPSHGFDAWFARSVAREPSARFPNARDAMNALDALLAASGAGPGIVGATMLAGQPASHGAPSAFPHPPSASGAGASVAIPVQRARRGLIAAILVGLATLSAGGFGALLYLRGQADTKQKRRARDEETDEESEETEDVPRKKKPPKGQRSATSPTRIDLSGGYDIVQGTNPPALGGKSYGGSVVISAVGDTFRVEWHVGSSTYVGVGFVDAGELVVAYGTGSYGVAVFAADQGRLSGRGTSSDAAGVIETQTLVGAPDFQGPYRIDSAAGGYGTATLTPRGAVVELRGEVRGTQIVGTALRRGDRLVLAYAAPGVSGGLVVYTLQGAELFGVWTVHGNESTGTENLKKR